MRYARLDSNDQVMEVRDFDADHPPVDIKHKEVRWRPLVTHQTGDYNPELYELNVSYVLGEDRVVEVLTPVDRNIEDLRQEVLQALRLSFHLKILDAMPSMDLVRSICVTRDMSFNQVMKQTDYRVLKDMLNA